MPRKEPTSGARPDKGDEVTPYTQELIEWFQNHANTLLLFITLVIIGVAGLIFYRQQQEQQQEEVNRVLGEAILFTESENNANENGDGGNQGESGNEENENGESGGGEESNGEQSLTERLRTSIERYDGWTHLQGWLFLQLAYHHYREQNFEQALEVIREMESRAGNSAAMTYATHLRRTINEEMQFYNEELENLKQEVSERFQAQKRIYMNPGESLPEDGSGGRSPGMMNRGGMPGIQPTSPGNQE